MTWQNLYYQLANAMNYGYNRVYLGSYDCNAFGQCRASSFLRLWQQIPKKNQNYERFDANYF